MSMHGISSHHATNFYIGFLLSWLSLSRLRSNHFLVFVFLVLDVLFIFVFSLNPLTTFKSKINDQRSKILTCLFFLLRSCFPGFCTGFRYFIVSWFLLPNSFLDHRRGDVATRKLIGTSVDFASRISRDVQKNLIFYSYEP